MIIFIFLLFFESVFSQILNLQSLSQPNAGLSSTYLKDTILFAGGANLQNIVFSSVDIYNVTSNKWTTASLSTSRYYFTAITCRNIAFFPGGSNINFNALQSVDMFDGLNWKIIQMSTPRAYFGTAAIDNIGLVFFAGGLDNNNNVIQMIDIYNINNNTWSIANLSLSRYNIVGVSLKEFVFFAGGQDKNSNPSSVVDIYNSMTNTWTNASLIYPRYSLAVTTLPGLVFFAGGCANAGQYCGSTEIITTVEIFNASSNKFGFYDKIPYLADSSATSLPDKNLVFIGGGEDIYTNPLNIVVVLDIVRRMQKIIYLSIARTLLTAINIPEKDFVFFAGGLSNFYIYSTIDVFTSCSSGTSNNLINSNICNKCNPGYYSPGNLFTCYECPPGFYCPNKGTINPIPMPAGCYSPNSGNFFNCPSTSVPGYYCPKGSINQIICPIGTYCDTMSMSSPKICPLGTYNSNTGSTSINDCLSCPVGKYCPIGTLFPISCPAEYYCKSGSVNLTACPPGFYCPYSTTILNECPPGFYCPESSSTPFPCPIGSYCPKGSSSGIPCRGGYECPFGSFSEIICQKNTFSLPSSGSCTQCPFGQFTLKEGAIECDECPFSRFDLKGWYCMGNIKRGIFVIGWIFTVFSVSFSFWKIYNFVEQRIQKMKDRDVLINIKNFIFLEKAIKYKSFMLETFYDNIPLINKIKNAQEKHNELEQIVLELKEKLINK